MKLEFKPDFEQARQQWAAFWNGENKRPLVYAILPKQGVKPVEQPAYLQARDGNFQPVIDQFLAWADTHEFIGEALPFCFVEWGPDTFSTFLGSELKFTPEVAPYTSWCIPFIKDWDDVEIRFRRESYWWQMTVNFIRELRRQCDSKFLINPPTLVANLDSLAAIRGTQNLLMDMIICPDKVKKALDAICRAHTEVLEEYSKELAFDMYGSISIEGTYCAGKHVRPQCDVSAMISPDMFREFVKPCLEYEINETDASAYHLDGSGAIKHIEALCEIKKLGVISFCPSAGNDEGKDWSGLQKRIDDLGKGQILTANSFEEIKQYWLGFKSRKLIFRISVSSKMEAEDLISKLDVLEKDV
jgi:hypothetical protein